MKKQITEQPIIIFSKPDPVDGVVSVFKTFQNGNIEIIGKVYTHYNSELGYTSYSATDLEGDELYPFTSDFTEIENRFLKHSKEQSEKSFIESMLQQAELQRERKNSLKSLRNLKFKNSFITKSI